MATSLQPSPREGVGEGSPGALVVAMTPREAGVCRNTACSAGIQVPSLRWEAVRTRWAP